MEAQHYEMRDQNWLHLGDSDFAVFVASRGTWERFQSRWGAFAGLGETTKRPENDGKAKYLRTR